MKNAIEMNAPSVDDAPKEIIMHHLKSFQENDLEMLMSDYTNESVLITPDGVYTGFREIEDFFIGMMLHFPKQKSSFDLDSLIVIDDMAYIVWHAKTPTLFISLASDTFVLRDGKIYQQTFVGQLTTIGNP